MNTDGDHLLIGNRRAVDLVTEFGSPLYVYDRQVILRQARRLREAFAGLPVTLHYACKANTNLSIMRLLRDEGYAVDGVSVGEMHAARAAGFPTDRITFTGNNVSVVDMEFVRDMGVMPILDSVDQVDRWGTVAPGSRIGVRVNHMGAGHHEHVITGGPDSKFGVVREDYGALLEAIARHDLVLTGLHQHIGSGILKAGDWLTAMNVLIDSLPEFPSIEWVDFGGGLGVPYAPDDEELDVGEVAAVLRERWETLPRKDEIRIHMQPGRFLVAESGWLLMTVQSVKRTSRHVFAGTDSGLHHHIRHPLYRAYHPICNATGMARDRVETAVAGNICEAGDLFTHGREIGEARVGDVIALGKAGAYGFVMGSHYNSRRLPAEVMVDGDRAFLIRRRECYDSLLATQEGLE